MNSLSNSNFFENPNPSDKCDIIEVENFEKEFSIKIPEDYRNYLCNFNGAKPINTICSLGENGETTVHHMYGLHSNKTYRLRIEKGMLVFADDTFGNKFAINVINGENYGGAEGPGRLPVEPDVLPRQRQDHDPDPDTEPPQGPAPHRRDGSRHRQ